MAAHFNRGGTQAAPALPDDPVIDLLAQTNAKVEDFDISPDGTRVCYVSADSGGFDVWTVNLDGSDNRRIVSMYPEQALHPVWSPDGQWVAYAARGDVFKVRADGSEPPINLSHGLGQAPLQEYIQWTPDGKSLVLVRSGPNSYLQVACISTDIPADKVAVRYVTSDDWNCGDPQISPDGEWIAFQSDRSGYRDNKRMDIWLVPFEGGYARNLTPNTIAHHDSKPRWSPDGKRLAFVSDRNGWRNIGVIDVASGETTMLTDDPWDSWNPKWSPDGRWIAYVSSRDWNFHVMKVSSAGEGEPVQLTEGDGVHGGFDGNQARGSIGWTPDGKEIVHTFMDHACMNDLRVISSDGGSARQLTDHTPEGLDSSGFVKPELIRYASKDGLEVPAFLYRPKDADGPTPLLLYAHANIHGFHVNGFYPVIQHFVSKGYTVLAPQVRGSGGLGKTYETMNFGDWGGGDIDDYAAGVEHLISQGLVDRERVVMQGGSTGGYFTAQFITRYPDVMKAAVCFYGPPDLIHFGRYGSAANRSTLGDVVGGDHGGWDQARDHWVDRSPFFHVDKVKTPLLILWGDRDNVRISLADDYYRALRDAGKDVEYVQYNCEPHGWYDWRPETLADCIRRLDAHYTRHIGG